MRDTDDLLATRTVAVRFQDGEMQYWLTTRVFSVGEQVERDGRTFLVSDVANTRETGMEPHITLQAVVTTQAPHSDVDERDREAWNVPDALSEAPSA